MQPLSTTFGTGGVPTTNPDEAVSLLPFGAHKGYGLMLIDELVGAFIGGSLPTLRGRPKPAGEKSSANFYFQVIHPEALDAGLFAKGRTQTENVKAVMDDIMGHGNDNAIWPGEIEADAARLSREAGGLLFTAAEIDSFAEIAGECGHPAWDTDSLPKLET